MSYTSYDHDKLEAANTMRIERTVYFKDSESDIAELTALPLAELIKLREESAAAEQTIFESLKTQAAAWEAQAGNTLSLDKALEYVKTLAVSHTGNKWQQDGSDRQQISNSVYKMTYHIYENTRYDREKQESVPYSYTLTWDVYTNSPGRNNIKKIAGQSRKVFADRADMEKYLNGRIKAYQHLFTELSPPIPKEYAEYFKINGVLLPGYTVEGDAPQQTAAQAPEAPKPAERAEPVQTAAPAEPTQAEAQPQPEQTATPTDAPPEPRPVTPIVLTSEKPAEKLKEITDRLEQGIKELFDSDRFKEYLRVMSKFHNYSFNNTLLIAMQKPDASHVAGFSAWKNTFGRNVMKGQKGIKILAPSPFTIKKEMEKIDPQTQKPVIGKDGKPVTEEREITIPAFKVVSVVDVSQTEGRELPTIGVDALTGDVESYEDFFKALKATSPVPIAFEKIEGGAHGYYHLEDKRIAIDEGMSELQTLKTAIHEIAHAKLHDIDKDAPKTAEQARADRRTREVEAESVAFTVCQHYGLDTSDYSFAYVAGWSSGRELAELKSSLETIRSAAAEIINSIDANIAELQKARDKTQEQPEPEKPVFDKLTPEQRQGLSDTVKDTLQTLVDLDMKTHGEVTAATQEAIAAQGYAYRDGSLEKLTAPEQEPDTFSIYQLKRGDETRDFRFEPYDRLQAVGKSVDPANYELVYTAPLAPDTSLESIFTRFNIDHPKDFTGHSLSVSDVVVLHQNGQDAAHYVDSIGFQSVPEFLQPAQAVELTPDSRLTGETVRTPRGSFRLTDMTREQIEAAGYGFHHQSDDGKYFIMGNGTRAFAIPAEQPQNHLKHVEDTIEQNDNSFDGIINNTPTVDELEAKVKAGEQISLVDLANAVKADKERGGREKKPSIRAQLKAEKEKAAQRKKTEAKTKNHEMEV